MPYFIYNTTDGIVRTWSYYNISPEVGAGESIVEKAQPPELLDGEVWKYEDSNIITVSDPRVRFTPTIQVDTIETNRIQKSEWFEVDNGDGTYSNLFKKEVYTWQGVKLLSKVISEYYTNGTVANQKTLTYYTGINGEQVIKES